MFRQDFSCPVLLKALVWNYLYGAVTLLGPTFLMVPVFLTKALAWSAFARHY